MDWPTLHRWADEFNLWSSVVINAWLLATGVAVIVSWVLKGKLSRDQILILAAAMLALVGIAAVVAIGWVVLMAGVYQSLFGPAPTWLLAAFWVAATAVLFWFYCKYPPKTD